MNYYGICAKCGTSIKNIVTIKGKTYGTTCAEIVLGVRLPRNYSFDYDKTQSEKQAKLKKWKTEQLIIEKFTSENWSVLQDVSRALKNAQNRYNDWEIQFVYSISNDIFGGTVSFIDCHKYETMEAARKEWIDDRHGSFPYIRRVNELSKRQQEIFERILNK